MALTRLASLTWRTIRRSRIGRLLRRPAAPPGRTLLPLLAPNQRAEFGVRQAPVVALARQLSDGWCLRSPVATPSPIFKERPLFSKGSPAASSPLAQRSQARGQQWDRLDSNRSPARHFRTR